MATLYLIPTVLTGEDFSSAAAVLPAAVPAQIAGLRLFFVENVRTARRFIRAVAPAVVIDELTIELIDRMLPPTPCAGPFSGWRPARMPAF